MNFLLDTHIILWWLADAPELTKKTRELIIQPDHTFYVSAASAWEIGIKKALGKLIAPDNFEEVILDNGFLTLPITMVHAQTVGSLPRKHDDPFDRMLIAQAKIENLRVITADKQFKNYKIDILLN